MYSFRVRAKHVEIPSEKSNETFTQNGANLGLLASLRVIKFLGLCQISLSHVQTITFQEVLKPTDD